jgi:serine/threonine protein kinase
MTQAAAQFTSSKNILDFYQPMQQVLGKGCYGTVEKGMDCLTGSPVAIKIQPRSPATKAEAFMASTLKAPHLVPYRDAFEEPVDTVSPKVFIVMDLVPQQSIASAYLKPKISLTLNDITCIAHQALEFLSDLFLKKIIYFDLKPENLIYRRSFNSLTVIDVGSARQIGSDHPVPITATPSYQAPEFILGRATGQSYDCWSLACTIYKLVTGASLFPTLNGLPKKDWNNFILQTIVQQIGKPTPAYLSSCKKAAVYFDEKIEFKNPLPVPQFKNWQVSIREAAHVKNWPSSKVDQLIDLMSKLLCYEKRATPGELLKHPFFASQAVVHLLHNPQKTGKMYIQRASAVSVSLVDLTPEHIASPDFVLNFDQPFSKCLHLPKDPEGKYIVILEKDGSGIAESCSFQDSNVLDIRRLQKTLADQNVSAPVPHLNPPVQVETAQRVPAVKRRLSFSPNEGEKLESPPLKKRKTE